MRRAGSLALALAATLLGAPPARGEPASPAPSAPVVASCANPNLPPAILNGAVAAPVKPLPLVEASSGGVTLHLAVAATERDRELGLMCVTGLAPLHGMVFVFATAGPWEFWMKRTLVPLDMLWVDAGDRITTIAPDVPASTLLTPDREVARRSGFGRLVIELPAGEAARDGLRAGTQLRLPMLQAGA